MKVTVIKTFVNENGISILKGRKLDVDEATASKMEADGVIESSKAVTKKKVSKKEVVENDRLGESSSESTEAVR